MHVHLANSATRTLERCRNARFSVVTRTNDGYYISRVDNTDPLKGKRRDQEIGCELPNVCGAHDRLPLHRASDVDNHHKDQSRTTTIVLLARPSLPNEW
jgi:hypothetical protein